MNNTEKSREMPVAAEPENKGLSAVGQKPVAVRSYTMTRKSRDGWLEENIGDCERAVAEKIKPKKENTKNGYRSKARIVLLISIAIILAFGGFVVYYSSSLNREITQLKVVGTNRYSAIRLANAAGLSIGSKLSGAESAGNSMKILQKYTDLSACVIKSDSDGTVTIYVEEYNAAVYFEVSGKYYAMTENLRVITSNSSSAVYADAGLIKAVIPDVSVAVCGRYLELSSGSADYIKEFLIQARENGMLDNLTEIRFNDPYSIETVSKNGNEVRYGSVEKINQKMKIVEKVESEAIDTDSVVRIDVSTPETAYIVKKELTAD